MQYNALLFTSPPHMSSYNESLCLRENCRPFDPRRTSPHGVKQSHRLEIIPKSILLVECSEFIDKESLMLRNRGFGGCNEGRPDKDLLAWRS